MLFNTVAITASLAASVAAFDCSGPYFSFYNRGGNAMNFQRLDPALFPGQQSPHLHSFDGGNGLSGDATFDLVEGSTCTTARMKQDKSLYWRPSLFWNGNDTGFYRVPDKFLKIYYKFGDSGNVKANVSEFPQGFQMKAGNSGQRSKGAENKPGVKWACLGENGSRIDSDGFPTGFTSCKDGLTSELTFPSCWNGVELDPKNPDSHMAYPTNSGLGLEACPEGFRSARFPSIFIEFWWDVSSFDGHYTADSTPWVLSQGDPTGFGFHADFRNGWETGVLAKATADEGYCNCGCGCGTEQMKKCFGDDQVYDDSDADFTSCAVKSPAFPGDDNLSAYDKLPGCNPLQSGPSAATAVTGPSCTAAAASGSQPSGAASEASSVAASEASASASSFVAYLPPSSAVVNKEEIKSSASTLTAASSATAGANGAVVTEVVYLTRTVGSSRVRHRRHADIHQAS